MKYVLCFLFILLNFYYLMFEIQFLFPFFALWLSHQRLIHPSIHASQQFNRWSKPQDSTGASKISCGWRGSFDDGDTHRQTLRFTPMTMTRTRTMKLNSIETFFCWNLSKTIKHNFSCHKGAGCNAIEHNSYFNQIINFIFIDCLFDKHRSIVLFVVLGGDVFVSAFLGFNAVA